MTENEQKAAERQKAKELAKRVIDNGIQNGFGTRAIEDAILEAIEWKNKEFEVLINSLPEPIIELIKTYGNESK